MTAVPHAWIREFRGAITVCDPDGIILEMNDAAIRSNAEDGGAKLIGTNLLACHPEPSLSKLKAFSYKYKDEKYGKGKQHGVMAQDLERAGLGHAVINTPRGKMVDGGKAALSSLGLVAALGKRVSELEGKK